ncbi:MAG TPA: hypothetical protein VN622_00080, partial [Clostridia bacterium]|nr:hypothetical protein [Clostridia bacterium]
MSPHWFCYAWITADRRNENARFHKYGACRTSYARVSNNPALLAGQVQLCPPLCETTVTWPIVRQRLPDLPEPFDHPAWIYELKYDGFRALAYIEDGRARL